MPIEKGHEELLAELKAAKEAQAKAELLLAGVLEIVNEALIEVDEQQNIILFSKGAEQVFGYQAEEIMGQSLNTLLRQRFRATHLEHFQIFLDAPDASRHFGHIQVNAYHKSGEIFAAEATVAKLQRDGKTILSILVYRQKDNLPETIAEQARLFKLYSDLSTDYVFSVGFSDEGKPYYTWMSADAFQRVTGYMIGELSDANEIYHPEDKLRADADRALSYQGIPTEGEYRFYTKTGELRWLAIKRFAEMDADGKILYMHGVAKDITESKASEEQRLELLSEQARVQSMTKFITGTSHDLMTSLSIIKTNVYLLQKMQDESRRPAKLMSIERQALRLQAIIQDMLTLVKLDSLSSSQLSKERIKLDEFFTAAIVAYRRLATQKHQELSLELPAESIVFSASTNYLHLAIEKILENAVHYTEDGGQLRIFAQVHEMILQIGVEDSGIGIAKDDLEHIFERFYRAEEARPSDQGTGLGLSIVKSIMDLHGGEVLVRSIVGKGSSFILCFPMD